LNDLESFFGFPFESKMAFNPYYPRPAPYPETKIHETFPEHHWPLEQTSHNIGHAVKGWFAPVDGTAPIHTLHADVRETQQKFYIDVEVPGLQKKDLMVEWVNDASLLVTANIKRPDVEEEEEKEHDAGADVQNTDQKETSSGSIKVADRHGPVHLLAHGRQLGRCANSFYFAVDVDHDTMEANLKNGLLRIQVNKKPHAQKPVREVEVKHHDAAKKMTVEAT
jgi:HSP20 family molecular chaperone IbpA